jgi:hypothetical protein
MRSPSGGVFQYRAVGDASDGGHSEPDLVTIQGATKVEYYFQQKLTLTYLHNKLIRAERRR